MKRTETKTRLIGKVASQTGMSAALALLAWAVLLGTAFSLFGCGGGTASQQVAYRYVGTWSEAAGTAFSDPFAIAVDPRNGNVLVTDARNRRVVVFNSDGGFLRQFGSIGNGPGQFQLPTGIAVGLDGSIYVADFDQDRIQKFTEDGVFILAWGGPGSGDNQFQAPNGLTVDKEGRVYVADFQNKVIKVFDGAGVFVGTLGSPGQGDAGMLYYPTDVAVTSSGDAIVADAYNHRIQRFRAKAGFRGEDDRDQAHVLYASAGAGGGLQVPTGVVWDYARRRIHIADSANQRIVTLDADGTFIGDWKLPEAGEQYSPTMLAVSPDGNRLYLTDTAKNQVIVLEVLSVDTIAKY